MLSVITIENALIDSALAKLRDRKCTIETATDSMRRITRCMGTEVLKSQFTEHVQVSTPLSLTWGKEIKNSPTLVPILRAGLEMWIAMRELLPMAESGFIDIKRIDSAGNEPEDQDSVSVCCSMIKFPENMANGDVILLDPMLATGTSASFALTEIKKGGVKNIKFICVIACEEGIKKINTDHPDVQIYCAAIDPELTKTNYIKPGLGDAGDKMYGKIH